VSILFVLMSISLYKSHKAFILIYVKFCGPLEKVSWPTTGPWPIG